MRQNSEDLVAIYHSHPTSEPIPSKTDLAKNYSGEVIHFIISLSNETPLMRGWWLSADGYEEADWEIRPDTTP